MGGVALGARLVAHAGAGLVQMRILFAADVAPDPNSGAAGTEYQTIQALRRLGHKVDEIWADDLPHRIPHGNLHYLLELPYGYRQVIAERCRHQNYDVIHANQGHCYLAAKAHHQAGRKGVFVCRSHGLDDHMALVLEPWREKLGIRARAPWKAGIGVLLDTLLHRHDRLAYQYASGVIVSSSLDADYLKSVRGVPPQRIACIPQAPSPTFLHGLPLQMDSTRLKRILHVGGFAYWKGVHAIAAAINQLFSVEPNLQMTWICRAEEHGQVLNLLDIPVRERIHLLSWVSQEELLQLYDTHGIMLCPSLFEGFGKVFLEAMARGVCVIGTPTGGMRDILRHGVNGYLVGFNDPEGIARIVQEIQNHPENANSVSIAAAKDAALYSWERVAEETAGFYNRLYSLES